MEKEIPQSESDVKTNKKTEQLPSRKSIKPKIIKEKIPLNSVAEEVISILQQAGYVAIVAGGCLRDYFLNKIPFDTDMIIFHPDSILTPSKKLLKQAHLVLKEHFPKSKIQGKNFPIIYLNKSNLKIEISPIHLDQEFISQTDLSIFSDELLLQLLYYDARERDLTENAIFYYQRQNLIIDFFNGIKDIKKNKLRLIKKPETSFQEDPIRMFRFIRSIGTRLTKYPHLHCNDETINLLQSYSKLLNTVNPDRCYAEVKKLFFRGYALETWKFMIKSQILKTFFLLPKKSQNKNHPDQTRHEIMVNYLLSKLDYRIHHQQRYNESLFFAIIFWGHFYEQLCDLKERNPTELIRIDKVLNKIFQPPEHYFNFPNSVYIQMKNIWHIYLLDNSDFKLDISSAFFSLSDHRLAHVFTSIINKATKMMTKIKIDHLVQEKRAKHGKFFMSSLDYLKLRTKDILQTYDLTLEKQNNFFILGFAPETILLTNRNKANLIQELKRNFQILLGRYAIDYKIENYSLFISSDSSYKNQAIKTLLQDCFEKVLNEKRLSL